MASALFRIGKKQVFLPAHVITLLRPKEKQPPSFATFKVPLTFNKFDLRDYLLHAYGVMTLGVRSQLVQQRPVPAKGRPGRIYRPAPIKMMMVELASPFVWPDEPADKTPWNDPAQEKRHKLAEKQEAQEKDMEKTGRLAMRDERGANEQNRALKKEARRLLHEGGWDNKVELDPKFTSAKKKLVKVKDDEPES
ncbi:hypothetical protein F4779DRAFT_8148 [Xylariaceae sp. FL0662B]|nr:hypothetical protein F4779DRAFT_8148 [Xylariaceae sp. FL0662B]